MRKHSHYPLKLNEKGDSWSCPECMKLIGVTLCDPPSYTRSLRRSEKNFFSRILALFILAPLSMFAVLFFMHSPEGSILPATSSSTIRQTSPADSSPTLEQLQEDLRSPQEKEKEKNKNKPLVKIQV